MVDNNKSSQAPFAQLTWLNLGWAGSTRKRDKNRSGDFGAILARFKILG